MGSHRRHITAASSSSLASPCSPWTYHPSAAPLLPSTPAAPPPSSAAHQALFPTHPSPEHAADENPRRRALSRRRQAFPAVPHPTKAHQEVRLMPLVLTGHFPLTAGEAISSESGHLFPSPSQTPTRDPIARNCNLSRAPIAKVSFLFTSFLVKFEKS